MRSADDHDAAAAEPWQQPSHVALRNGDAAGGRREIFTGKMKKYCTSSAFAPRNHVIVKYNDYIVKLIISPESFVTLQKRKNDKFIV